MKQYISCTLPNHPAWAKDADELNENADATPPGFGVAPCSDPRLWKRIEVVARYDEVSPELFAWRGEGFTSGLPIENFRCSLRVLEESHLLFIE